MSPLEAITATLIIIGGFLVLFSLAGIIADVICKLIERRKS